MKTKLIIVVMVFLINNIYSQQRINGYNNHAWLMYVGSHKFSEKFGFHLEVQWRRNQLFINPQQLLLRSGINYYVNKKMTFTAGYCFVKTYPYGVFPISIAFPENRIWQQVQFKNNLGKFEFLNRYRLEQRMSYLPVLSNDSMFVIGNSKYTNRIRLMQRLSIPFKGNEIIDKSFYLSLYNELFIGFGKNVGANFFDQNRAYVALGYKLPNIGRIEIGFLEQTIFKNVNLNSSGQIQQKIENNHTLQIGLTSSIDFYKKK
jgi:hypothetical protein